MGLEGELHPKIIENRGWVTWFRGKQKKKKEKNTTGNENIQEEYRGCLMNKGWGGLGFRNRY